MIRWKSAHLPDSAFALGHGYCFCVANERRGDPGRPLAFIAGFEWCGGDGDIVILYDPDRFPSDAALAARLKTMIEARARLKNVGEAHLLPDLVAHANA